MHALHLSPGKGERATSLTSHVHPTPFHSGPTMNLVRGCVRELVCKRPHGIRIHEEKPSDTTLKTFLYDALVGGSDSTTWKP